MISIAIFTAIAVQYMLPQQQQQQREDNVTNAQLTATQILQAALDYRTEEAQWPGNTNNLAAYLPIINNNPWGNNWQFFNLTDNQGLILITQAGDSRAAIALAARFGGIARVCSNGDNLCATSENNGTWVYIGISPP
jgi:type II secretory pathway pseudopilin PulG